MQGAGWRTADWVGTDGELAAIVRKQSERCLETYAADPNRVKEDFRNERRTAESGYATKQIHELVQNAADALTGTDGRIEVVLSRECLYVANEGRPFERGGVEAIMAAHLSGKGEEEIGRYGLGFKSVVMISDTPQIFSRTGSFGFDLSWSQRNIAPVVRNPEGYPLLRLACPMDPRRESDEDPVLQDLMSWATTIVKVPLTNGRERLASDLAAFPSRFLLFSPHVTRLELRDLEEGVTFEHSLEMHADELFVLRSGGATEEWAVARARSRLSAAQSRDIGAMKKGDEVVVQMAVPTNGRSEIGEFWAYFPTQDRTSLRAIVNAPWKLSPDRTHLQEGDYNAELLEGPVADLFSRLLPKLHDRERPEQTLSLYPGRYVPREMLSWADGVVNQAITARLKLIPSVPDSHGILRVPRTLKIHPEILSDRLGAPEALAHWSLLQPQPDGWLHPAVAASKLARPKAVRLADRPNVASLREWLEALLETRSIAGSAIAIEAYVALGRHRDAEARDARIVLDEDGTPCPVRPGKIFLRTTDELSPHAFVHPELASLPRVVELLRSLGIDALDKAGELRALLGTANVAQLDWAQVWVLARGCSPDAAFQIMRDELPGHLGMTVRVRNAGGEFVPLMRTLLPGPILRVGGSGSDAKFAVDLAFHANDQALLARLGAVTAPRLVDHEVVEPWLDGFIDKIRDRYAAQVGKPGLTRDRIEVAVPPVPLPIQMYKELSEQGNLALTRHLLDIVAPANWSASHPDFGKIETRNPVTELITSIGIVETSVGPFPLRLALGPGGDADPHVMPVCDLGTSASWLRLPTSRADLKDEAWEILFHRSEGWELARRERLYAWGAEAGAPPPNRLLVRHGSKISSVPRAEVAVAMDDEDVRSLLDQQFSVLQVREEIDRDNLLEAWSLEDGRRLLDQNFVFQASGPAEPIEDIFPAVARMRSELMGWELQPCSSMALEVLTHSGMRSRGIRRRAEDGVVYTTAVDPKEILRIVSQLILIDEPLSESDIDAIVTAKRDAEVQARIDQVKAATDVEEKLVVLFGEDTLRKHVPAAALSFIEEQAGAPVTGSELGRVFLAVHGVAALKTLKSQLSEFDPPKNWVGGSRVRQFVSMLGFPPEYAGTPSVRRDPLFYIAGPTTLPPAHPYQRATIERIRKVLGGEGRARGMVGLPTGAGKTRVAVEAIVGHMQEHLEDFTVLWIAQTDELCEQAVETWSYIWRAIGPDADLTVGRLWGGNTVEEATGNVLVVATPDTLKNCIAKESYAWLAESHLVVTDEAHHAIAPQYTKIFEWLGRSHANVDDVSKPMIGLSATPFRGFDHQEGKALARRYASNRLDEGVFGDVPPHEYLQQAGVLAKVSHQVLGGVDIEMSQNERMYVTEFRALHPDVEERLGADAERNRRIVESIEQLPDDWTAILFATSVQHAQVLASLLTYRGIPAASISGETDRSVRRHVISEFKAGRIRVITNYGVLAQGFDAPAVEAVYITRPTFSPNLYQQMIGRGLRGPGNGGSEEVLIVNVEDNFEQFGDQMAFREFDYLWSSSKR
jgi:superfamily II DNA or RNA helicase